MLEYTCCLVVVQHAEGSTVVDMTSNPPIVLRRGLGDAEAFDAMADELVPA
jgi:tRNA A37 threonylcarbamoyladenosine synthetase subunit TsaC/SUA5/YrdC